MGLAKLTAVHGKPSVVTAGKWTPDLVCLFCGAAIEYCNTKGITDNKQGASMFSTFQQDIVLTNWITKNCNNFTKDNFTLDNFIEVLKVLNADWSEKLDPNLHVITPKKMDEAEIQKPISSLIDNHLKFCCSDEEIKKLPTLKKWLDALLVHWNQAVEEYHKYIVSTESV
ncbi:hypothetical protein BKA70DRAFT_1432312 [Coprinopsis sp. MPI-PUGE-AT-0042]|nr:hypothetical protein BKA70DRAFT_1432312 [Coprinopsis sp. MPI-PUGE-AT-0042]